MVGSKVPMRPRDRAGREKAFRGARLAMAENISMDEAAKRCGSKRSTVQEAMTILRLGTPEEISSVENHEVGLGPMVDRIIARTTPEERKAVARPPTFGPSVQANREFDADVWGKLREAIDALTSLPVPADVMTIVKKNAMRTEHVSRKVLTAQTWLEEFVNAWTA